jgi:hypothetical protein
VSGFRGLLLLLACAYGVAAPTFKIAGHVVRHADNRPVKRARVTLAMVDHRERSISCMTGENGEFSFTGLAPMKYALQVTDHGWTRLYQQTDAYSTAIAVGPELDTEHIVFPLDSPARISGTVLDGDGDPVTGAMVYLFGRSLSSGLSQMQMQGQTNSSMDGDFHFGGLAPGTYYIAASGHPWYAQNFARSDLDLAFPLTYYDGGFTLEAATPLQLEEAARVEVHFTLHAVPALHLGVDGYEKHEGQHLNLQLSHVGPGGILLPVQNGGGDTGVFGVAPGDYQVTSTLFEQNQASTLGSQTVSLTNDSTVHLNETIKTSVKGKVILEGEIPQSMAIWMGDLNTGYPIYGAVLQDGTFEVPNVQPGRYSLLLPNAGELYMQSVQVKGGAYKNDELPVVKGADIQLTITAVKGVTKVNGRAVKGDTAVAGAMVLLVPEDPNHGNNIPRDQSDSDGTFTLNWALPGRYTLIAIDNGRGLAYADRAVLTPYLALGRVLDLPLAEGATVQIEVQPRK